MKHIISSTGITKSAFNPCIQVASTIIIATYKLCTGIYYFPRYVGIILMKPGHTKILKHRTDKFEPSEIGTRITWCTGEHAIYSTTVTTLSILRRILLNMAKQNLFNLMLCRYESHSCNVVLMKS